MGKSVQLRGYRYSVYNRIVQVALHEKGVSYSTDEVNPFTSEIPETYLKRQPFGRVPVLTHGEFDVYETTAIVRYLNAAFDGPELIPADAKTIARSAQVISILDNYGYRPMIRQVFAHRIFGPSVGEQTDESEIEAGVEASRIVLSALNTIVAEGVVLNGQNFTIADCHLAPMIAYFIQAPEGADSLKNQSALFDWWAMVSERASIRETAPGLPKCQD
ncbi:glutathione S-transferase family protein [Labrenzia sp. CE80]|uniref:glutathione S-transferase family protein n=1 Tax=Labrenzia sp. CE80 TaxID=1788986 RepID=UPI00129BCB2D|nr:glutathione S-transferase family protein [Labrenzia sp. CE80]